MGFVKSAAKKSLLALTKKGELTPRFWARFFEAFVTKDELISFADSGDVDHGLLGGLTDDDHTQYYNSVRHNALSHSFVDHDDLTNVGTNTHSDIDDHIDDGTIHFTEGSIDHGSITGLDGDDHTQYVLADGTRNITGSFTFEGSGNDVTFEGDTVYFEGEVDVAFGVITDTIGLRDEAILTLPPSVIEGILQVDAGISTEITAYTTTAPSIDDSRSTIICDATSNAVTINLPSTADVREGIIYNIKAINVDNPVTVSPNGLEEINGSNSDITLGLNESITIQSDGSNWWGTSETKAYISITTILADGTSAPVTVNLPEASTVTGYIYNIKAINADNAVTVSTFGVEQIDGSVTDIVLALMEVITIQSDGSNWWII